MMTVGRRRFVGMLGAAGAAACLPGEGLGRAEGAGTAETAKDFDFIFLTDTHLEPELEGAKGCDMAFRQMRAEKAEFAIHGGDHVFDALQVPKERSLNLFEIYGKTEQDLGMKVYHTIGNHDCVGVYPQSGVAPGDPLFGKRFYQDHIGKTYYSFERGGVHFIVLDTIGLTPDRAYEGRVDAAQVQWLSNDLAAQPAGGPIVVVAHIPLVSAIGTYLPPLSPPPAHHGMTVVNAPEVIALFDGHNVLAVLQGHIHVNERVEWRGVPYITSGAVCGNWWKGVYHGTPEGYTVVSIRGGKLTTRYETYGFHSVAPENT